MTKYYKMSKNQLDRAYSELYRKGQYDECETVAYILDERFGDVCHKPTRGGKRMVSED